MTGPGSPREQWQAPASGDGTGPDGAGSGRGASVIGNVVEVLRCFSVEEPVQGVTEIAEKVGLHKSSVSRILATLEKLDIIERDQVSRKFRLGLGLLSVAGPLLANLDARRVSLPVLRELTDVTRETSALVVWSGSESVTVEQVASPQQVKHTTSLGSRYDTALSASVQVFLAQLPAGRAGTMLEQGTPALPDDGSIRVEDYLERLSQVRDRGYAVNFGETSPEEVGVAAPVRDHRDEVVAAVLVAAPAYRVSKELVPTFGAACTRAAALVSNRLGAAPR